MLNNNSSIIINLNSIGSVYRDDGSNGGNVAGGGNAAGGHGASGGNSNVGSGDGCGGSPGSCGGGTCQKTLP